MPLESQAAEGLEAWGLGVARVHLDSAAQRAAAAGGSYPHFLGYLLEGELSSRQQKRVELNLQFARFAYRKRLADLDSSAQPGPDRRLVEELAPGRFLAEGRNVILLGPPGVGQTHLAVGLGVLTAERGHRVYFTTALDLAVKLTKAVGVHRLHRELKPLTHPKLLIIDEVGYLSLDGLQANLWFQVICQRYQKGQALVVTSTQAFGEWGQVFADDAVLASAALDRLLHRSTVLNIRGESYRLKERRPAGVAGISQSEEGDRRWDVSRRVTMPCQTRKIAGGGARGWGATRRSGAGAGRGPLSPQRPPARRPGNQAVRRRVAPERRALA